MCRLSSSTSHSSKLWNRIELVSTVLHRGLRASDMSSKLSIISAHLFITNSCGILMEVHAFFSADREVPTQIVRSLTVHSKMFEAIFSLTRSGLPLRTLSLYCVFKTL